MTRPSSERLVAARDVWSAFFSSRAVVWAGAVLAIAIFGWQTKNASHLDPLNLGQPFGNSLANLIVAPVARFDSIWYLTIAQHGYNVGSSTAFFPVLPAILKVGDRSFGSAVLVGLTVSAVSSLTALYLLHRLVALDFDLDRARSTVWIAAWFPGAMVLSAVYSEPLLLLASVGAIYAARQGRWATAGLLGGVAAATRSGGVLLLVPLLIIYLHGPRSDGTPKGWAQGRLGIRYRPRPDLLWLLAIPAGLVLFIAYLARTTGDPTALLSAQAKWHRSFIPLGGIGGGLWSGLRSAFDLLVPGVGRAASSVGRGIPPAWIDVREILVCGFLLAGIWLVYEAWRRLPGAYTAYAICGLALALSFPAAGSPLMSLPRFECVLFPLWIALGLWLHERGHHLAPVLAVFGALMAITSGLFALWVMAP